MIDLSLDMFRNIVAIALENNYLERIRCISSSNEDVKGIVIHYKGAFSIINGYIANIIIGGGI